MVISPVMHSRRKYVVDHCPVAKDRQVECAAVVAHELRLGDLVNEGLDQFFFRALTHVRCTDHTSHYRPTVSHWCRSAPEAPAGNAGLEAGGRAILRAVRRRPALHQLDSGYVKALLDHRDDNVTAI
jgi:hypothetical protein